MTTNPAGVLSRKGALEFLGDPALFLKVPCYVAPGQEHTLPSADVLPDDVIANVNRVECPGCGRWQKAFQMVDCRQWPASFFTLNSLPVIKWCCDVCFLTWEREGRITPGESDEPQGAFDYSHMMEYGGCPQVLVDAERFRQDMMILRARGEIRRVRNVWVANPSYEPRRHSSPMREPNGDAIRPAEQTNRGLRETHGGRIARLLRDAGLGPARTPKPSPTTR